MNDLEFMWLVGLLEGEGTFTPVRNKWTRRDGTLVLRSTPRIQLQSNDKDVVERVAGLISGNVLGPYKNTRSSKPSFNDSPSECWVVTVARQDTEELLKRMLPHMSIRRQQQIQQALSESARRAP